MDLSLPAKVPVQCGRCATVFTRPRSTIWRQKPGNPMYCSQRCQFAAARVHLTCEACGKAYTKKRCEVEKAHRLGFVRSFCSKACYGTAESTAWAKARATCDTCGKTKTPAQRHNRYCSASCRPTTPMVDLSCSACAKPFRLARYEHAKKLRKGQARFYCSPVCVAAGLRSAGCACLRCGKPTGSTDRGRRYCSTECRLAVSRAGKQRACPQCGREFHPQSSRTVYCDRTCANEAHARRMIGRGNSRYKTGTSYASWFRLMRPLIYERDGSQCRACGAPDQPFPVTRAGKTTMRTSLVVHHLNERPEDNRPQNLILICKTCHAVHHKSATTPFPWFATYTASATRSMTSKWKATTTSLRTRYSSTTA